MTGCWGSTSTGWPLAASTAARLFPGPGGGSPPGWTASSARPGHRIWGPPDDGPYRISVPQGGPARPRRPGRCDPSPCRRPPRPAGRPLQVSLRETCGPAHGGAVKYEITALGGAGRTIRKIAGDIVNYLLPGRGQQKATGNPFGSPGRAASPMEGTVVRERGVVRYYADSGESGRWHGRGADALGLRGEVRAEDFADVLSGRDPATSMRLISAQGSAGRRPRLGVGNETRRGPDGVPLYDTRDAAAVLDVPHDRVEHMLDVGTKAALARLFGLPVRDQPPASYLVPVIDRDSNRWVTDAELSRCQDALGIGATVGDIAATGPPDELVPLVEAARLVGVTPQHLRKIARYYEANKADVDAAVADDRKVHHAYLVAERGTRNWWFVTRGELTAYVARRKPPAVRLAYDLTLSTEKSLGVLALLSGDEVRRAVLGAIDAGNDWALAWLERHAAAAREDGEVVPVKGWTVASFQHHTSRALDPFPHIHNVVANTVEDHKGVRRALHAYPLYHRTHDASALATAEMRWQLTRRLGVRWRTARHGGWEIAGIGDDVLREFSQRTNEIEDALRELEDAIGRGATTDEIDRIKTTTRPNKTHVPLNELLAGWWHRAEALGFHPDQLAACIHGPTEPTEPDIDALYDALAAPEGICANLSVFDRGDVLHALLNHPVPSPDGGDPQPVIVSAKRLGQLADGFLASRHVELVKPATHDEPASYSTREILAVQNRIVTRYQHGRHHGGTAVPASAIDAALARHPQLTDEQRDLVRAFCSSGHKMQCAIGRPGAGKTTAMAAARDAWQAAGLRVLGAAVKGEAARTLGATADIPTETLAWYLAHEDPLHSPLDARTVLVVDEASTISDRDLDQLGWLAEQTGATLRLIGDPAQHGAVEAGGMFRVLCERYPADTPELTRTHRLQDPHDRAAADHLRAGDVAKALDELDAAGHLHIVDDDLHAYTDVLARWWQAHQVGQDHPMVNRSNDIRRALNRLAHQLRRTAGEIGTDEITAAEDRRYSIGDRVIARIPNRRLHPPGEPAAYVRNGATGTITHLRPAATPDLDYITVDFDDLGEIDLPRRFFDEHDVDHHGRRAVGIDHAYAVTSYAVTGATYTVSTSRIDETSSRAETYVDITRGQQANHLYLTRRRDELDYEQLPRVPPDSIDQTIAHRLATSQGERTAWELRQHLRDRAAANDTGVAVGL
jgi:conjugative relaxase-like TrwC/TraI family protein